MNASYEGVLGRSPTEFLKAARDLTKRGVRIEFVVEGLFIPAGEDSPIRNFLLLTMGAFHEASQSWTRERHQEASVKGPPKMPATCQNEDGPLKNTLEDH